MMVWVDHLRSPILHARRGFGKSTGEGADDDDLEHDGHVGHHAAKAEDEEVNQSKLRGDHGTVNEPCDLGVHLAVLVSVRSSGECTLDGVQVEESGGQMIKEKRRKQDTVSRSLV